MSSRGVEKQIKKLREAGIIKRNGADFGGYWEIVKLDDKLKSRSFGDKSRSISQNVTNKIWVPIYFSFHEFRIEMVGFGGENLVYSEFIVNLQ